MDVGNILKIIIYTIIHIHDIFRIGINPPGIFFDMFSATKLLPGHHTTFSIKPTKIVADESLRDTLSPLQRNCRFEDEMPNNMTLFTNYSMAACQFECMISIR